MDIYSLPVSFYFSVSIAGISDADDSSFQEVSGLNAEMGVEEITEGGENRFKYRVPTQVKYGNLILKRGLVVPSSALATWCLTTIGSDLGTAIQPKTITVKLLKPGEQSPTILSSWDFLNAWPVKVNISDFKSQENAIAIETMEFAYTYFTKSA